MIYSIARVPSSSIILLSYLIIQFTLFSQESEPPGIHQLEHRYYKNLFLSSSAEPGIQKPIPLQEKNSIPIKTVYGYHPYWMNAAYPNYNYNLLSTIAYFGVDVDAYGNIENHHGWPLTGLINLAHSYGVRVVLVAINFDSNSLTALLSNATNRTRLINNLLDEVARANADGINIDFEEFPGSQKQNLNLFMRALADTFHKYIPHSSVSIALPAVNWSNKFDYYTLATICDALFIMGYNYHWNGSSYAGPVAPLSGWGTYNITWTVNDYLSATQGQRNKLVLGLPYYGIKWPTTSATRGAATTGSGSSLQYNTAESEAQSKGKLRDSESQTPWYRYQAGSTWYQAWYDDSLSLSLKYQLALNENLQGVGMWALGYDGTRAELWGALRDLLGASTPPPAVSEFRVENIGSGIVRIRSSIAPDATGYRVYIGTERDRFRLLSNLSQPQATYSTLSPDSTYFFKMTATNPYGESPATEVLAVSRATQLAEVLIVNGYDRLSAAENSRDFSIEHGRAIKAAGYAFDSASNEAIINGRIDLKKYKIVDWILGQESTVDETFNDREQQLVKNFLEAGGRLFVSGSEIGWDLDFKGSASDKDFYHKSLKASYVVDKVNDYQVHGTTDGIFSGVSFSYSDGANAVYQVGYPDGIEPSAGSTICLKYRSQYNAGIQYSGKIGTAETRLVNLGLPFETIYPESARHEVMARILTFLTLTTDIANENQPPNALPDQPVLYQNYPNPFNQATTIKFYLPQDEKVSLKIYNLLGQVIKTLLQDELLLKGSHQVEWLGNSDRGEPVASGTYLYRLELTDSILKRRLIYLK